MQDTSNSIPFDYFMGKGPNPSFVWFIGVVEDIADPLTLGRAKVRCFGFHPAEKTAVPTHTLPWAHAVQSNSASNSGVGWSPTGLKNGTWVIGFFADGITAQYPIIWGSLPGLHRPGAPSDYIGNSGAGYFNDSSIYSGAPVIQPGGGPGGQGGGGIPPTPSTSQSNYFAPTTPINPGAGSVTGDSNAYLTHHNDPWPLQTPKAVLQDDQIGTLRFHYATGLALDKVAQEVGGLNISDGYRDPAGPNVKDGVGKTSMHVQGRAVDIRGSKSVVIQVLKAAVKHGFTGFGSYTWGCHIDTGGARVWGPNYTSSPPPPKWFMDTLYEAGWHYGKKPLEGVPTNYANTAPGDTGTQEPAPAGETQRERDLAASGNAIRTIESGGNYQATGPVLTGGSLAGDRAYGAYQVMGTNVGPWTQKWYGTQLTPQQFLANPAAQDAVFKGQFGSYMDKYGPTGAAQAWYGGPGSVGKPGAAPPGGTPGPNVGGYSSRFDQLFAQYGGQGFDGASQTGFTDPTGSFPYGTYKGKPSTNRNAVGVNAGGVQSDFLSRNHSWEPGGFPMAGDKGTFSGVDMGEAPQYPFNMVYAGQSGHILEIDDTPGVERVNLEHRSGTRTVFGAKGNRAEYTRGNAYRGDEADSFAMVGGAYRLTSVDDMDIRSTSDMTLHSDGSYTTLVKNDYVQQVSGKLDMHAGEVVQMKGKKLIMEFDEIDILAKGKMNIEVEKVFQIRVAEEFKLSADKDLWIYTEKNMLLKSKEQMNIYATKNALLTSAQNIYLKSSQQTHVRTSGAFVTPTWLVPATSKSAEQAKKLDEKTAASTDLGTAPDRAVIKKRQIQRANPDIVAGLNDAIQQYGANDPTNRTG